MLTADVIREKMPAIRHLMQGELASGIAMLRGSREALEILLRAEGFTEFEKVDEQLGVWTCNSARDPILIILIPRTDTLSAYSAHPLDPRELNIPGLH